MIRNAERVAHIFLPGAVGLLRHERGHKRHAGLEDHALGVGVNRVLVLLQKVGHVVVYRAWW